MNIINKILSVGIMVSALVAAPLWAQTSVDPNDTVLTHFETNNPQSDIGVDVSDFVAVPACYVGTQDLFVVIDSVDNSVDMIFRRDKSSFDTTIRVVADISKGRHDLNNVLRVKSVGYLDGYVLFIASAKKDSSYLAVVDMDGNIVNRVDFGCCAHSFKLFPDEILVFGKNQVGYDLIAIDLSNGVANISNEEGHASHLHYHVPKQSERIQESDPIGIGLTVTAVSVVFLALLCISLILKGYGKLILKAQDRKAKKVSPSNATEAPAPSETSGEIYAAIAAAIYMYDEELHDDENTVITIEKVERAWTPWNAKFYNMNHYFNNKR